MANLGKLQASVTADVSGFQSNIKKAESAAEGFKQKVGNAMDSVGQKISALNPQLGSIVSSFGKLGGGTILAGIAAVGSGLAVLVVNTAEAAKEIRNLSTLAGSTPQQFQEWAYAAKSVGVEQEQLSDILKDFREKMGEAQVYGSGAFKDMLDTIGQSTGLTMESFKGLSGPEGLQLIVKRMEDAGYSTEQMSAVLESLGSDATKLIPILKDNSDELNRLGTEARDAGVIMSDETAAAAIQLGKDIDLLKTSSEGLGTMIASSVIPSIANLVTQMRAGTIAAGGFWAALLKFGSKGPTNVIEDANKLRAAIDAIDEKIGNLSNPLIASEATATSIRLLQDERAEIEKNLAAHKKYLNEYYGAFGKGPAPSGGGGGGGGGSGGGSGGGGKGKGKPATVASSEPLPSEMREMLDLELQRVKVFEEFEKKKQALIAQTSESKAAAFHKEIEMINILREEGRITEESAIELIKAREKAFKNLFDFSEKAATQTAQFQDIANRAASSLKDAFIDFATSADRSFSDFARNFLIQIAGMIQEAIIFNTINKVWGAVSGAFGGLGGAGASGGNILSAAVKSANGNVFSPGSGGPNLVPFANGGVFSSPITFPMSGGKTGLMGEAGPEAIMPLTRKNGRLGVVASGMGGTTNNYNVSVNVETTSNDPQGLGNTIAEKVMRSIAQQELAKSRRTGGQLNPI